MNISFLQNALQDLESAGMYRRLKSVESPQQREITLEGRRVLNFCSNDYLGLANDSRLKQAALEAVQEYGIGSGASRLICGNMGPHDQLEKELAALKHTEAGLVYSSGYMANVGIISGLMDHHGVVFSDRFNHASIIDGIILSRARLVRYPHADMQALEGLLEKHATARRKLIVTDTVFSMDGDRAPLKDIVDLAQRFEAMVMVDEAHAFGVLGEDGGGLGRGRGVGGDMDIQLGTLSKAAGCFGAYACGSRVLREYLLNKSRAFIYTTAMPPSLAQASRASLRIIKEGRQLRRRLLENASMLRRELQRMGFDTMQSTTPIIPLLVKDPGQAVAMSQRLLEQGLFVQAIRPPTVPAGTSRLRLTVTVAHTQEDLNRLLNAFKNI